MDFGLAQTPPSRRKGKTDNFTDELSAKLKERRKKGLSAEITDEDDDDGLGSDEDDGDDFLSQYKQTQKKKPLTQESSAGQRSWAPPTFKKQGSENERRNSSLMNEKGDGRTSPAVNGRKSPYQLDNTKGQPLDSMKRQDTTFGQKPSKGILDDNDDDDEDDDELLSAYKAKGNRPWQPPVSNTKPKEESLIGRRTDRGTPTKEELIFGRKTPTQDGRQSPNKGRQTPTKEELIFGKKTPTQDGHASPSLFKGSRSSPALRRQSPLDSLMEDDDDEDTGRAKKPWQPPTFNRRDSAKSLTGKKSSLHEDEDEGFPMAQPRKKKDLDPEASSRPMEPRPKPRHRLSHDQSHDEVDAIPIPKKNPSSDIFGRRKSSHDEDEQLTKSGRRTPVGAKGRQSPAPSGGRKTPTGSRPGSRSGTPVAKNEDRKTPTKESNKSSSLLDMLGGSSKPTAVPRRKSLLTRSDESQDEEELVDNRRRDQPRKAPKPESRRKSLFDGQNERRKSYNRLGESSDEEDEEGRKQESFKGPGAPPANHRRERESSLVRDVTTDPQKKEYERLEREREKNKRQKNSKQRDSVKLLENMIDEVADAQVDDTEDTTMKPIKPEKSQRQSKTPTPHKPKPRYATTPDPATLEQAESFEDTTSIRQSVYNEWYKERMKSAKKEKLEKEKKVKQEEEKKAKEAQDKKLEAMASFKAWQEDKKEKDKEHIKKKRQEEKKKREKEDAEEEKKKDATLAFRSWKENKDVKLKEDFNKTKREELNKAKEEGEMKKKKQKEAEGTYESWKKKKDKVIGKQAVQERREKKKVEKELSETQRKKEKDADELYEQWIEQKEKQLKREHTEKRRNKFEEYDNPRPAWSPSGKTVPFGR